MEGKKPERERERELDIGEGKKKTTLAITQNETHRNVLLHVVHVLRSTRVPQLDYLGHFLIGHQLIQECLYADQLGNNEAVLPGDAHYDGQRHEQVGENELETRDGSTLTYSYKAGRQEVRGESNTEKLSWGQSNKLPNQERMPSKKDIRDMKTMRLTTMVTTRPTAEVAPSDAASNTLV